jgi:hypothetical protein
MRMSKPQTAKQMQAACARFNADHPIGSSIKVRPGAFVGPLQTVEIVRPGAYILGGHTPVVQVTGGHGCIALTHVEEASAHG